MSGNQVLQKYIAEAGVCSRRKSEELIREGKVKVDGSVAKLGDRVSGEERIELNGKLIKSKEEKVYYIVNKPIGYISTVEDRHAKKKVVDLVPARPKVWPVGRLDKDSRGLVILTNDGELTQELTHPKFEHEKEYEVEVDTVIKDELLAKLNKGIKLEEGVAKVDTVKKIGNKKLNIILHQGWNRQIRRMIAECGYRVVDLKRVRMGDIRLGKLKEGEYFRK